MPLDQFAEVFIPLFVAMDVLGILPIFISFTHGMAEKKRRALVTEATIACLILAGVILATGRMIFNFLGITENDFRIAGGLILLILAIMDLLFSQHEKRRHPKHPAGVVPIGIPLIMGPAAITTIILLVETHGYMLTAVSLVVNLIIVWVIFWNARLIVRLVGESGSKAIAKVAALFLAAIAVMMIRVGVQAVLKGG